MEMKKWERPTITVIRYAANEYVATCYTVKCDVLAMTSIQTWIDGSNGCPQDGQVQEKELAGELASSNYPCSEEYTGVGEIIPAAYYSLISQSYKTAYYFRGSNTTHLTSSYQTNQDANAPS